MNKCPNCGTEYEGNFCPNCGEARQEEKVCPNCGTSLSGTVRFCNNCGYKFPRNPAPPNSFLRLDAAVCYRAAHVLPRVCFLLFAVLTFLFLALPLAEVPRSIFIPFVDFGNGYNAFSLTEVPQIQIAVMAYVVLVLCSEVAIVFYVARETAAALGGKGSNGQNAEGFPEQKLSGLTVAVSFIYIITIGVFSYLISAIKDYDNGMKLLRAGPCPILMIVFSAVFFVVTVLCGVAEDVFKRRQSDFAAGFSWLLLTSHRRVLAAVSAALVVILALSIGIPAGIAHRFDGTYYLYDSETGKFDESQFFKLNKNRLSDQAGAFAEVTFESGYFNVYADLFGMQSAALTGAVRGDIMKISTIAGAVTFAKESHRHDFGKWETVVEPTCLGGGQEAHSCLCGKTELRALDKVGQHKFENGVCIYCGASQY